MTLNKPVGKDRGNNSNKANITSTRLTESGSTITESASLAAPASDQSHNDAMIDTKSDLSENSSYRGTIDSSNSNQAHSHSPMEYAYTTTSFTDDDADDFGDDGAGDDPVFEKICALMANYSASTTMDMVDENAYSMLMDLNKKRLSQLKIISADLQQILDIMDIEQTKLETHIKYLSTKNKREPSATPTSTPRQKPSVQPASPTYSTPTSDRRPLPIEPDDTDDAYSPRKRQKQRQEDLESSPASVSAPAPAQESQPATESNGNLLSQLKAWYNTLIDPHGALLPTVESKQIHYFHSLAWKALVEKLAMNDPPSLPQNRPDLKTLELFYVQGKVTPSKRNPQQKTKPNMDEKPVYDSALLALMVDGFEKNNSQMMIAGKMAEFLDALKRQAPDHLVNFLLNCKPGDTTTGLEGMEAECLKWKNKRNAHHLVYLIYAEIMIYRYGLSPELEELEKAAHNLPCIHVHWQLLLAEPDYSTRRIKSIELLQSFKNEINGNSGLDVACSRKTTTILLYILQRDGVRAVLEHLMPISSLEYLYQFERHRHQKIDLTDPSRPQHISLTDHDIYCLWTSLITFYLSRRLPQRYYTYHWSKNVGSKKLGKWKVNRPIGIDWMDLLRAPLAAEEQIVVASILLGLLAYFNQKAFRSKNGKKCMQYLMATVWNVMGLVNQLDDKTLERP